MRWVEVSTYLILSLSKDGPRAPWIPAFAGMTPYAGRGRTSLTNAIPAKAGIHNTRFGRIRRLPPCPSHGHFAAFLNRNFSTTA